jgi:citrate synthase
MLHEITQLPPFQRFQILLPVIAADDLAAYDLRPEAVVQTGGRILQLMTLVACNADFSEQSIAQTLCNYWQKPETEYLISTALIFCADHELNASSFAARVVASTNATPYAAVSGGLAALGGSKHGGHTERVEAFLREADSPEQVARVMVGRMRRGEPIPGFGHPLYPQGDPRGRELLRLVGEAYPDSPAVALAQAAIHAAADLIGEAPTVDLALVTLSQTLGLPEGTPLTLFALGRTIGWIGHAMEQYRLDRLIRPRARYVGEKPSG